jgi:hypothetical protein
LAQRQNDGFLDLPAQHKIMMQMLATTLIKTN